MRSYRRPVWQTLGLGAVAGIKPATAPVIAGNYYNDGNYAAISFPVLKFVCSPVTTIASGLLSAAERHNGAVEKKSHQLDINRLAANFASGAFAGAAVYRKNKQSMLQGMLIGGAAALITSVAGHYFRKHANKLPALSNEFTEAFQDAFAYSSGVALTK
ncbi:DUF4126 family protein [Mucilaginibacter litoreus]|uniref:DUF4126 family protein n=1 Tax=Mucilaginibacter litoreus TaxID=1048221 RepID=A0ABW3AS04_9SPHI